MIVIADAGPLLHLFWVDAMAWALPPLPVAVVSEVWGEVQAHAPQALADPRLRPVVSPADVPSELLQWRLDPGERAALSYAVSVRDQDEVLVLCDEREARHACSVLSLPVVGSIGLILEASQAGRVTFDTAAAALRDLPGRGRLHVRPELIERAFSSLPPDP